MLCHSLVMLCQSGSDHSCFVIIFNETDQSSDFAIFVSLSFSRDETGIAARSHHVRRNNLQRNPPAFVQSLCVAWQNIFRARLVRSKRQWGMLRCVRRRRASHNSPLSSPRPGARTVAPAVVGQRARSTNPDQHPRTPRASPFPAGFSRDSPARIFVIHSRSFAPGDWAMEMKKLRVRGFLSFPQIADATPAQFAGYAPPVSSKSR